MPIDLTPPSPPDQTAEVLAEARLVVRAELAAVTMTARELAALGPGDVIATGVRLGAPVVLRVGGVEAVRAEICDLEGELALRVLETRGSAS